MGAAEYAAEVFQLPMSALLKQHDEAESSRDRSNSGKAGKHMSLSPNNAVLKRTSSLFHPVSKVESWSPY